MLLSLSSRVRCSTVLTVLIYAKQLVLPSRKYIKEGPATQVLYFDNTFETRERYLFLFNDLLLVTSMERPKMLRSIPVRYCNQVRWQPHLLTTACRPTMCLPLLWTASALRQPLWSHHCADTCAGKDMISLFPLKSSRM